MIYYFSNERDTTIVELLMQAEDFHRQILINNLLPQISSRIKDFHNLLLNPPPVSFKTTAALK